MNWIQTVLLARILPSKGNIDLKTGQLTGAKAWIRRFVAGGDMITAVGLVMVLIAVSMLIILFVRRIAVLYAYDGGTRYNRRGVVILGKRGDAFTADIPSAFAHPSEAGRAVRYRLTVRPGLIRHNGDIDISIRFGTFNLTRPLKECVEFVA